VKHFSVALLQQHHFNLTMHRFQFSQLPLSDNWWLWNHFPPFCHPNVDSKIYFKINQFTVL